MALRSPVSDDDHIQGDANAPLELIEYGDYQCPHCGRAYPLIKSIQQELGDKLRFVYRNFPLTQSHPQAMGAALAAEAAGLQGAFWEMHDMLFENQKKLNPSALIRYAESLDLDIARFCTEMEGPELRQRIEREFYSGMRSGVNGTPGLFINGTLFDGDWENGGLLNALQSAEAR
jgi:protein-disulfide isomerase